MRTILLLFTFGLCFLQSLSLSEDLSPNVFQSLFPVKTKDLVKIGYEEDALLDFMGLTRKYGYPAEEHEVVTPDGYILSVFRIRHRRCNTTRPVLMLHGILDSADTFINPGVGLAYLLADACHDVWCANVRGNRYSREHIKWDPDKDKEFWQFSFHEHGTVDLAATVDYILSETKADKVNYIGHSQGTTSFFVLTSTRPEYNAKFNVAVCLSPVAYLYHVGNPMIKVIAHFNAQVKALLDTFKINEILGRHELPGRVLEFACQFVPNICAIVRYSMFLQNRINTTDKRLRTIAGHVPAGTSTKNLHHFSQIINENVFRMYDAGVNNNLKLYNQTTPPDYDLSKVTAPVVLVCAKGDVFATPADLKKLRDQLPNVLEVFTLTDSNWGHLDYTAGNGIPKYLAPKVMEYLNAK
ncbi:lipase 1 [Plutella xylostella]|uniref:lipase 1 n=1 Tax=Plutella xylostella TaxID=51655 RepID=UPI0020327730|nr:lipase 1 [Plutella xylostella]